MDHGVVVSYDAQKGFGFVRSRAFASNDVFVHVSVIVGRASLRPGQRVRFLAESTEKGLRATRVEPGWCGLTPMTLPLLALAIVLIAGIGALVLYEKLSLSFAWLSTISTVTFGIYAWDKRQAKIEGRRVPEAGLLGLALVGGSFGALGAMLTFRHKTNKTAFLVPFAGVMLVQAIAVVWWVSKGFRPF